MDITKLYPPISYPVSRGTPMISPMIKWDHSENYVVPTFESFNTYEKRSVIVNISDKPYEYLKGNLIDGMPNDASVASRFLKYFHISGEFVFPAAALLNLVWETFSLMHGIPQMKVKVVFEDVKFTNVLKLRENQDVRILCHIHRGKFFVFKFLFENSSTCLGFHSFRPVRGVRWHVINCSRFHCARRQGQYVRNIVD